MRNLIRYQVYYLCCVVLSSDLLEVISTAKRTANHLSKRAIFTYFRKRATVALFLFFFITARRKLLKATDTCFLYAFSRGNLNYFA